MAVWPIDIAGERLLAVQFKESSWSSFLWVASWSLAAEGLFVVLERAINFLDLRITVAAVTLIIIHIVEARRCHLIAVLITLFWSNLYVIVWLLLLLFLNDIGCTAGQVHLLILSSGCFTANLGRLHIFFHAHPRYDALSTRLLAHAGKQPCFSIRVRRLTLQLNWLLFAVDNDSVLRSHGRIHAFPSDLILGRSSLAKLELDHLSPPSRADD